jgi:hypothetical protein
LMPRPHPRPATASAPCGQGTGEHPGGVRGLGRERYVLVDLSFLAALEVLGPAGEVDRRSIMA